MELQLALALPIPTNSTHKKRTFSQLLSLDHAPQTLTLLPLTPNHHHHNITKDDHDEDVEAIVGWPPVNYLRKKLRVDNCGDEVVGHNDHMLWLDHHHSDGVGESKSNTLYVKVKMEGVGIARKVDLGMHQSFQTLKETLMDMFGKCIPQSNTYELAYQDKEGDWLHAEDVPWRSFVRCARRLKLVKSST